MRLQVVGAGAFMACVGALVITRGMYVHLTRMDGADGGHQVSGGSALGEVAGCARTDHLEKVLWVFVKREREDRHRRAFAL